MEDQSIRRYSSDKGQRQAYSKQNLKVLSARTALAEVVYVFENGARNDMPQ